MTPDQVEAWVRLFDRYGTALVLLVLVVVYVVKPLLDSLIASSKPVQPNHKIEKTLTVEKELMDVLGLMLDEFGCQYAYVWQFHNGMTTPARVPMMNMSITHEANADDVEPRGYKKLPVSVLVDFIDEMLKTGFLEVTHESALPSTVNLLKRDGISVGCYVPIKDMEGNLMGILACAWKNAPETPFSQAEWEKLHEYSVRVGFLLERLVEMYRHPRRRCND